LSFYLRDNNLLTSAATYLDTIRRQQNHR